METVHSYSNAATRDFQAILRTCWLIQNNSKHFCLRYMCIVSGKSRVGLNKKNELLVGKWDKLNVCFKYRDWNNYLETAALLKLVMRPVLRERRWKEPVLGISALELPRLISHIFNPCLNLSLRLKELCAIFWPTFNVRYSE